MSAVSTSLGVSDEEGLLSGDRGAEVVCCAVAGDGDEFGAVAVVATVRADLNAYMYGVNAYTASFDEVWATARSVTR